MEEEWGNTFISFSASFPFFTLLLSASICITRCYELEKPAFKTNGWLQTYIKRDFTNYLFCIYSRSRSTSSHLRGMVYNSHVYKRRDAEDNYATCLFWLHPPIQQQLDIHAVGFLLGQAQSARCTDWHYLPSSRKTGWHPAWQMWQESFRQAATYYLPYTTSNTCQR